MSVKNATLVRSAWKRSLGNGILRLLCLAMFASPATAQLPTNNDPNNQIRFNTPAGANARRQQLVDWIWSGGLPTSTLPAVSAGISFPTGDLTGLNQSLVSSVDRLDANVSGMDFHSISYLLHPVNPVNANRLAIVHQGHVYSPETSLTAGVGSTANRLLQEGYTVIAMNMPLCGWNTDQTINIPGGSTVTINSMGSSAHNDMFNKLVPPVLAEGEIFRFFLEPVVQNINYFKNTAGSSSDVAMVGLSGGGWTTAMAAAIDPRITLNIPVAGSAPLYIQNEIGTGGDAEQFYTPLYDERITADQSGGGVATYLECYALGAYGDGRRQIMVTIPGEPVGLFPTTWVTETISGGVIRDILTGVMADLHHGQWGYAYDLSSNVHQISPWAIDNVIMPAVQANAPEPSSFVLTMMGLLGLGLYVWRRM